MVQCVICKDSELEQIDVNILKCKICKNQYVLGYEILKHDDEITNPYSNDPYVELSGHSEVGEPILMTSNNHESDLSTSILDREKGSKTDIKIPWYFKNTDTTKVIDYNEY